MKETKPIPEPMRRILSGYCDVNAFELVDQLAKNVRSEIMPAEDAALFKQQLREAITRPYITPEQYQKLTGDDEYFTQELLQAWLQELWVKVFGNDR